MKTLSIVLLIAWEIPLFCQVTSADYERAFGLREKYQGLMVGDPGPIGWIDGTERFWYRRSVLGGHEFVVVDAIAKTKRPAFDHDRIAASLSAAAGEKYTSIKLPFSSFTFTDNSESIGFTLKESLWKCTLTDYSCKRTGPVPAGFGGRGPEESFEIPGEYGNDVSDGMVDLSPQESPQRAAAANTNSEPEGKASPDGKWEAVIRNFNVFLRPKGKTDATPLSLDGSEGNYYTFASIAWSPDSTHLAAYRVRPGYRREVHYVESSPTDQLQPKHSTRQYAKPGDAVDMAQPVLFDTVSRKQTDIDRTLFPNPYSLTRPVWRKSSAAFTFEYNQRGHQIYRVIEVDAQTAKARAEIDEESKTFINYRPLVDDPRNTGKIFRRDLDDGKEILWMSERDGWSHLYLYDGVTGRVKNQITKGDWVVRAVLKLDEDKRQIWFLASGMHAGKDPYFTELYRINLDGTGLTPFTEADGNHLITLSPDAQYYVDSWSRSDVAPTAQLRRTSDKSVVMELEHADAQALRQAGWRPPEVFTAPGRDGKTGIWGVIYRPRSLDPSKKYPVIEIIYAGPQGSFVPKGFNPTAPALTELGFIVVQIDGMGTANRSKAFHDVAWRNLKDAGFEDRILWHKAVAAKYSYYDISRVGIYGTSAGGQNAMGGALFHPEFYKAAVANSGCHDNRMDKIWWNEQWMGWPLGQQYAESSNMDNAYRLQGKLLLVMGEMDTNVDPSSTMQVVNALIKANKKFDLLVVPGGGHGAGGDYYQRLLDDFFVHNLMGIEPPEWTAKLAEPATN